MLEGRDAPAIITVTDLSDVPVANQTTLRDALGGLIVGQLNVIQFAPNLSGTINLTQPLPNITTSVDIVGPGPARITIQGDPNAQNPFRIFNFAGVMNVLVSGLTIRDGRTPIGGSGAGIMANGLGNLTISNCSFINNMAEQYGGAVYADATPSVAVYDSTFSGNEAGNNGGAIEIASRQEGDVFTVWHCTFGSNEAGVSGNLGYGGAISVEGGKTFITQSSFTSNMSWTAGGGALYLMQPLIQQDNMLLAIDRSTFRQNQAPNGNGGAISNVANASGSIRNTTITGNTANQAGGILDPMNRLQEMNNTINNNSAQNNGNGGNPFAGIGGGIFVNAGANGGGSTVNCIIAGNTASDGSPDFAGPSNSLGHNLIGTTDGSSGWIESDLLGLDPELNPVGDYGGPTQTMTLEDDSPAIDAGDNTYVMDTVDQRGYNRIVNGTVDIGAVEMQANEAGNTNITVSTTASPSIFGETVTLSADVVPVSSSSDVPTGTVTFYDTDGTPLGTETLDSSGHASINVDDLAVGGHDILAVYSGDTNFNLSTGSIGQLVNPNVAIGLASSNDTVFYTQAVTFTVTLASTSSVNTGTPTGQVDFFDYSTNTWLGSAQLVDGVASITRDDLSVGTHSVAAYYKGDSDFVSVWSDTFTQQINANNTATTLTASSTTTNLGDSVSLFASVVPSGGTPFTGPTGLVYFFDSTTNTWLGSTQLVDGVATYTTSTLGAGDHSIVAYYAGDDVFADSWSDPLTITVVG